MINANPNLKLISLLILLLFALGCSGGSGDPVVPDNQAPPVDNNTPPYEPPKPDAPPAERGLWGLWDISYNPGTQIIKVSPRDNLTTLFPLVNLAELESARDCLHAKLVSYNPDTRTAEMEVTLRNGFAATGYDVRAIFEFEAAGTQLGYADGWTKCFDAPGGASANPFNYFGTWETGFCINPNEVLVRKFKVSFPENLLQYKVSIAIDACWVYSPDTTIMKFSGFWHTPLYNTNGATAYVFLDLLDPTGDIDQVYLIAPIITNEPEIPMQKISGNTWRALITHRTNMLAGQYDVKYRACSNSDPDLKLVDNNVITISKPAGWAATWGGLSGGDDNSFIYGERAMDVAVDSAGNAYVTGMFLGTVDFGGYTPNSRTSNGVYDAYLAKYNPAGLILWVKSWGGADIDCGNSVSVDSFGDVYVTGQFTILADFDPTAGEEIRKAAETDIFLCKYSSDGDFLWVRTWGGVGFDYANGICHGPWDNVYVTGSFEGNVDFDPGPTVDIRSGNGRDAYLVKYHWNGEYDWARTWGGDGFDIGEDVAASPTGYVYTTGCYWHDVTFDPDNPGAVNHSNGNCDAYLLKYSLEGDYQWVRTWGGEGYDHGYSVAISGYNYAFVAGSFQSIVDFDPGYYSYTMNAGSETKHYINKFSHSGAQSTVCSVAGIENPVSWRDPDISIDIEPSGYVYVAGKFDGSTYFSYYTQPVSNGGFDAYIAKYSSGLSFSWARCIGGPGNDACLGIALDNSGNIYASGYFNDTVDFDPGSGVTEYASHGMDDSFLVKLMPNGNW